MMPDLGGVLLNLFPPPPTHLPAETARFRSVPPSRSIPLTKSPKMLLVILVILAI